MVNVSTKLKMCEGNDFFLRCTKFKCIIFHFAFGRSTQRTCQYLEGFVNKRGFTCCTTICNNFPISSYNVPFYHNICLSLLVKLATMLLI